MVAQRLLFTVQIGLFAIRLTTDRNIFARRHRQRASDNAGHSGQDQLAGRNCRRGNACHQAAGGQQAIVGAQNCGA